jgi:hypothetical protein
MTRQNNYKQNYATWNMNKRGQVTIFVIIAVAIVGFILLVFLLRGAPTLFKTAELSPNTFLRDCMAPDLTKAVDMLAKNGSYEKPEGTVMYKGDSYKYLCYTSEYYKTCTIQQPFIKNNFEKELSRILKPKAEQCAQNLITEYKNRGYSVLSQKTPEINISIVPSSIRAEFFVNLALTKDGVTQKIDKFQADMDSEMYNLLFIAASIVDFEATFGDSETTAYMQYYPDLRIDKIKRDDGSKIYILTNVVTKEEFRFASRSLAWPAGYGFE